jgi:hypothetical protein
MHIRPWLRVLPAVAVVLVWAGTASAQAKSARASHHSLDDAPTGDLNGIEAALDRRLGLAGDARAKLPISPRALEALLKNKKFLDNISDDQKQKAAKFIQEHPEIVKQFAPGVENGKFSDEQLKKLGEVVKQRLKDNPPNVHLPDNPQDPNPNPNPLGPDKGGDPPPPNPAPPKPQPGPADSDQSEEDWFRELGERFASATGLDEEDLGDILNAALKAGFGSKLPGGAEYEGMKGAPWLDFLRDLDIGGKMPSFEMPDFRFSWFNFEPPSAPQINGPSFNGRPPSGPSWSGGGMSGGDLSWHWLLWLAAAVVLAVVLWKTFARGGPQAGADGRWALGPWPVDPSRVATRGDLVIAFEYLALKLLGLEARLHHHLELEARLAARASAHPERQRAAAERLAGLYEQAKYAPPEELLSDAELADARGDLAFLAGVAAA